jgi:hypothetical protein
MRITHRVALELDVDEDPDQLEPEEWDLEDLLVALAAGLARPLRTIHGMVLDTERDRLSVTLQAISEGIDELVDGYWIATASPRLPRPAGCRGPRPSLGLLVELEAIAEHARHVARHLQCEGL